MNLKSIAAVMISVGILTSCFAAANQKKNDFAAVRKISATEGFSALNENPNITLVDVRGQVEYEARHIPGAILIPNESINGKMPKELPNLDAPIIVYCRSGVRSAVAAEKLSRLGYKNIMDMGGIINWKYAVISGKERGEWKRNE